MQHCSKCQKTKPPQMFLGQRKTCKACVEVYRARLRLKPMANLGEYKREVARETKQDMEDARKYEMIECQMNDCGYISIGPERASKHRLIIHGGVE